METVEDHLLLELAVPSQLEVQVALIAVLSQARLVMQAKLQTIIMQVAVVDITAADQVEHTLQLAVVHLIHLQVWQVMSCITRG